MGLWRRLREMDHAVIVESRQGRHRPWWFAGVLALPAVAIATWAGAAGRDVLFVFLTTVAAVALIVRAALDYNRRDSLEFDGPWWAHPSLAYVLWAGCVGIVVVVGLVLAVRLG